MLHRDKIVLKKILSEIDIALDMVKDTDFERFDKSEVIKRAVCMTVINIGELVKTLSSETREAYTNIPWRNIAGFRDIAAHKYQTLNMSDVFETVTADLPQLCSNIKSILDSD